MGYTGVCDHAEGVMALLSLSFPLSHALTHSLSHTHTHTRSQATHSREQQAALVAGLGQALLLEACGFTGFEPRTGFEGMF